MDRDPIEATAAALDHFRNVPPDLLLEIVTRDGSCMWLHDENQTPDWLGNDLTDRQMAAAICAGCPVQRECLELEFRTVGAQTLGVWGALSDDDRRAVLAEWEARRDEAGDRP